jgi:hypothetical protein
MISVAKRGRILTHAIVWGLLVLALGCSDGTTNGSAATDADASDVKSDSDIGTQPPSKPLSLLQLSPPRGPLAGGGDVDIEGTGFSDETLVWFADQPADVLYRAGGSHIYVRVPAGKAPGTVEVRARNGSGTAVTLPHGYAYLTEVTVDSFEPTQGPALGGVPITVRGSGFLPGDKILVGLAEAQSTQVVDGTTLVALTPPCPLDAQADLSQVLVSVRHGSGLTHAAGSFTCGRAPRLHRIEPGVVGLDGGAATLNGAALGNVTSGAVGGGVVELSPGSAGSVRGAQLPALSLVSPQAKPGPQAMTLQGPFGATVLNPAILYANPSATQVKVYAVVPAQGLTSGGTAVAVLVDLPDKAAVTQIRFGGKDATFQQTGGALSALTPAHAVGAVDVEVVTAQGTAKLDKGFTYGAPVAVTKVVPDTGPVAGGTPVSLTGSGFVAGCKVRIGLYFVSKVVVGNGGKLLSLVTPPGAAGAADVLVECPGASAVAEGAFSYTHDGVRLDAVLPASGATGGGQVVRLHGSGFQKGMQVYVGGKSVSSLVVLNGGEAECKVPSGPAGVADVNVVLGKTSDTLLSGFTYYSPAYPDGGTWGESVTGTLNVAVLNIYTRTPIADAIVQVGQPGQAGYPKYRGLTDDKGQIVFSGTDLVAPLTVSATKESFSASSIVSFDARNATLLLFPYTPPSEGTGEPPAALPWALLRGKVLDVDKYLLVPPTNCLKSGDLGDKTCDACESDADCPGVSGGGGAFSCVDNGTAGKRCLSACENHDQCGTGFLCVPEPLDPNSRHCKPTLGIRKVFCSTTVRDLQSEENPPPTQNAPIGSGALPWPTSPVDEATGVFEITSRLDELAIQCIGGYISNEDQRFVPMALGLRRHVFPQPGATLDNLDVHLDIPLQRALPIRLDHPQKQFGSTPGSLSLDAWIDLGSDGYVQLPGHIAPGVAGIIQGVLDDLLLQFQPVALPKELDDASYVYYARVGYGSVSEDLGPLTATLHSGIEAPGDDNVRIRKPDGAFVDSALGIDLDLTAVLGGADGQVLIVARNGRLFRGTPDDPKLVHVPAVLDPYAEPILVLAADGTPTDATLVGELGLVQRVTGNKVTDEKSATSKELHAVCSGPLGRVAVGAAGVVQLDRGDGWQVISSGGVSTSLQAVTCTATGAVAVGLQGKVVEVSLSGTIPKATASTVGGGADLFDVTRDGQGDVWLAGDKVAGGGPVLLRRNASGEWQNAWPAGVVTPTIPGLRALVPLANGVLLLVDREGVVRRLDASGVKVESAERKDLRPRDGVALPDGTAVLVGEPGLWLGPFLTVPAIAKPDNSNNPAPIPVEWSSAPGPEPSFTRVHLDGNGFPFWWIYVAPELTSLLLPDFQSTDGIEVLPLGYDIQFMARIDRVYVPGFSIHGFGTFDLEFGVWRSWATNTRTFTP